MTEEKREKMIEEASEMFKTKGHYTCWRLGVIFADQNPKSPWISIKDKLPCDEKDMVIEFLAGKELRTKKVVVLLEDGFTDITFMYSFPPHGWHWNIDDVITHWFPIPEPPKE